MFSNTRLIQVFSNRALVVVVVWIVLCHFHSPHLLIFYEMVLWWKFCSSAEIPWGEWRYSYVTIYEWCQLAQVLGSWFAIVWGIWSLITNIIYIFLFVFLVCLFVCLYVLFVCLFICLYVCLFSLYVCLFVCLFVCMFICLYIYLFVCLFACLSVVCGSCLIIVVCLMLVYYNCWGFVKWSLIFFLCFFLSLQGYHFWFVPWRKITQARLYNPYSCHWREL